MARDRTNLPHDFPDRVVREAVTPPDNLRALAPAVAIHLDYGRRMFVLWLYFLDGWPRLV